MALEYKFGHDGEQRNSDRSSTDRLYREARGNIAACVREIRAFAAGASSRSATSIGGDRYLAGGAVLCVFGFPIGSAASIGARTGVPVPFDRLCGCRKSS